MSTDRSGQPARPRAAWTHDPDVLDLTDRLEEAARYLRMPDAASATGLTVGVLKQMLLRARITAKDNPRAAMSRPAARVGTDPLYSRKQISRYQRAVAAATARQPGWEVITSEDAERRGLRTADELAADFGVHKGSLSRWANTAADFPAVVGVLPNYGRPGNPPKLRHGAAVGQWLKDHGVIAVGHDPDGPRHLLNPDDRTPR